MHSLYFTRHGETVWNVENKICGITDSPLTAHGREQAAALGAHVRDSGVHIDEILYSPLSRDGAEFKISKTHFADRYSGGESMLQLAQRIYDLLDELKADEGKTYLLVAHNGIARVVRSYFCDMTNEEYAAFGIKNCEFVEYTFDE